MPYLVEVHIHTLELKIGGAIVAEVRVNSSVFDQRLMHDLHARAVEPMLARDGLPLSP